MDLMQPSKKLSLKKNQEEKKEMRIPSRKKIKKSKDTF
jgi:hypothetical protein